MFIPKRVIFEQIALDYPLGQQLYDCFKEMKEVELTVQKQARVTSLPNAPKEKYSEGKKVLVIAKRKTLKFQSCKPSAHYQLPLVTGCMGQCEYCYLNTQFGNQPYLRLYVNVDDILEQAKSYIDERDDVTIFEGAATSDPLPLEDYSHSLAKAIDFFGKEEKGRFRFVSKYNNVDSLLDLQHNNHTEIRFSINAHDVISRFEHKTPSLKQRLVGIRKVMEAGYPSGVIIAPVFMEYGWKEKYAQLFKDFYDELKDVKIQHPISFEVISHRFTARAKNVIEGVFENSTLPMEESERQFKYGQFGYGKYVYPKEQLQDMKEFFEKQIEEFPLEKKLLYII